MKAFVLVPRLAVLLLLFAVMAPGMAAAQDDTPRVTVTDGQPKPQPIAITDFIGLDTRTTELGAEISNVIAADLERSGLFRPIPKSAFIQTSLSMDLVPRFGDWRIIGAQTLVQGKAEFVEDGRIKVEFRLWDSFSEQQMIALAYHTVPENWRRIAHIISDAIYKRLTGEDGYFDTRIVYIAESGPANARIKRLAIMDQDGANHRFLTDGSALVLTPRFSPTLQEITYMSYYQNTPRVYVFNIDSGRQELLGDFPGMTFAPRFSPDGNGVIMSMAQGGNTEIFTMDLRTRRVRQLTRHPAIDTSPSFSPDGRAVVFNSDRGGSQQLYVMDSGGGNVRRISFGDGRYATPVWSPRGDYIAFTKISGGRFYIGVMRPDGSGERLLTQGYLVEGPTWAPNGRVLMFFKEFPLTNGVTSRVYSIDLTGYNEREVKTPVGASDPAWSPLIP
ncbi:MAG: Tol-Pal system beta propeller repeat protein TolB [Magnetospiraceae bacterium]